MNEEAISEKINILKSIQENALTYFDNEGTELKSDEEVVESLLRNELSLSINFQYPDKTLIRNKEVIKIIAELLANTSIISDVTLVDAGLGDKDASLLANALALNNSATYINLGENDIGEKGAIDIAKMLEVNNYIFEISLYKNHIGNVGIKAFAETLKYNNFLIKIGLKNNNRTEITDYAEIENLLGCNLSIMQHLQQNWKLKPDNISVYEQHLLSLYHQYTGEYEVPKPTQKVLLAKYLQLTTLSSGTLKVLNYDIGEKITQHFTLLNEPTLMQERKGEDNIASAGYIYTNLDIDTILTLRLNEVGATVQQLEATIGNNIVEELNKVVNFLQDTATNCTIILPYSLNSYHCVGLIFTTDHQSNTVSISYLDSLGIRIPNKLATELQRISNIINYKVDIQEKESSTNESNPFNCGPLTIENFIQNIGGKPYEADNMRLMHQALIAQTTHHQSNLLGQDEVEMPYYV